MGVDPNSVQTRQVLLVCGLAVFNYLAFYVVGILLARVLLPADYGDYCAAVALANILAVVATLGLEKYSVKALPAYMAKGSFNLANGFLKFSLLLVAGVGAALAVGTFEVYQILAKASGAIAHPASWLVLFLPIMAVTRHGIEVLTAHRAYLQSMLVYRGLLPLAAILIVGSGYWYLGHDMTSSHGTIAFGAAWAVSLLAVFPMVRRSVPAPVRVAERSYRPKEWMAGSLGFFASVLVLTTLSNGVLLVLEVFHNDDAAVGVYGAVVQTSSFVVLMATSTNRLFLPRLSALVAEGEDAKIVALLRERARLIGPLVGIFGLTIFLFGEPILDMYRHHSHQLSHAGHIGPYAERGYWALLVMCAAKIVSTWLAIAPFHLMYLGRSRQVLTTLGGASLLAMISAIPLSRQWNELGAAVAYAVPISLAFLWMGWTVRKSPSA